MATRFQCARIASLFFCSTTLANLVYRLQNQTSYVFRSGCTSQHCIYPETVFISYSACTYAHFRVSTVTITHTSYIHTHRGVTLRCHGSFGWLCVAVSVVLNTHNLTLSTAHSTAQHTALQHTAHSSTQHTAAHGHHHIALHRIISHQVLCISPFNLIAIDDKSPC
jgi:hypothetical protein